MQGYCPFSFTTNYDTAHSIWRVDHTSVAKLWSACCDVVSTGIGNPDASYQWYFEKRLDYGELADGLLIQPNSSLNITLKSNNRILYFEKFKEEHNGKYICNAKNFLGSKNYTQFPQML